MANQDTRVWLSRASTPKVRSGCITCKSRHVKCDEAKPTCKKCQKVGRICGGYRSPPVAGPKKTRSSEVDNPASNSQVAPLLSNPATSLFETATEGLYFQFFLHQTSHKLSGNIASVIWTTIVPQACVQDFSIRHAVIAIAALDRTEESAVSGWGARPMLDSFGFGQSGAANHYEIAVSQYHRAIKAMGNKLTAGAGHNIRKILIFCLLTICFESYIGNQEAADLQALTGINLLSTWLQRIRPSHPFHVTPGISSPSPDTLEDDIFHAFIRLRQRVGTAYTKDASWRTTNEEDEAVKFMPRTFSTLKDAKVFWELVERRIERSRLSQDEHHPAAYGNSRCTFRSLSQIDHPNSSVVAEHASAVIRWTNAFEGVLGRAKTPAGNADFNGAAIVKMRSLIARQLCLGLRCDTEMVYDEFLQDYVEIIALARAVVHNPQSTYSGGKIRFKFDIGMVPTLLFLIILCRQQMLRREALTILEAYSCREGSWDSSMGVSIGKWVLETEGARLPENSVWVPAHARVRLYTFFYSPLQCSGVLVYQTCRDGRYPADDPKQVDLSW